MKCMSYHNMHLVARKIAIDGQNSLLGSKGLSIQDSQIRNYACSLDGLLNRFGCAIIISIILFGLFDVLEGTLPRSIPCINCILKHQLLGTS